MAAVDGSWSQPTDIDGGNHLTAVSCAAQTFCVAVDTSGNALTYNGSSWSSASDGDGGITSLSCPSASLCLAVDSAGYALVWTTTSDVWAEYDVDGIDNRRFASLSCSPSADFCAAVDDAGNVFMLEDPGQSPQLSYAEFPADPGGDITAAACASDSLCVAGDANGSIASSTAPTSSWFPAQPIDFDNPMTGVSCPTTSLCVATDNDGKILASTDPLGRWSVATQDTSLSGVSLHPSGVSCASPTLCVAVDGDGNVLTSTTPTGTGTWSTVQIDTSSRLVAVSCASQLLCVAVDAAGNVLTTTSSGSAWNTQAHVDTLGHFTAVSCGGQPQVLCAAVDDSGNVVMSSSPASSSWPPPMSIDPGNYLSGVSCPTTTLCVAVDSAGNVLTWQPPTGQQTTGWSPPTDIDGSRYLTSVSCSSVDLCVATDTDGNVLESTDPTSPSPTWTPTPIDGISALEAVSCVADSLCAAVDLYGNAVVGAPAQTLQIVIGGSGSVSIGATTCASTCSVTVEQGAQLTLTATPASGYTFAGWSGGGCTGTAACVTTIAAATQVFATFLATPGPPVTVTSPQPTTTTGTPPISTHPAKPPTAAQVRALLGRELAPGGHVTLATILRRGSYTFGSYGLPEAGAVTLSWYFASARHREILVARGTLKLRAAGKGRLQVKLNAKGRRLLAGSKRIRLVARAAFKPTGAPAITTSRIFVLVGRKR